MNHESWCAHKDQKLPVDLAYIDFSKAFDKVPHNRPLYKLSNIGVGGSLLLWIKDFLVERQQRVRGNLRLSLWETAYHSAIGYSFKAGVVRPVCR